MLSCVQLSATLWTVFHQAPLSMWFPRQEYWKGLPFPSPEDLSDPGIKSMSLISPALGSLPSEPPRKPSTTGVGSLSLLQGNLLTQESNRVSSIAGRFFTSWATRDTLLEIFVCSQTAPSQTSAGFPIYLLAHLTPNNSDSATPAN